MVNDTIAEVQTCDNLLKEVEAVIGEINRVNFEKAERHYWEARLLDDARATMISTGSIDKGVVQSLQKIGLTAIRSSDGISFLTNEQLAQLEQKGQALLEKK